jgi:flagellar basal-body rod protein FlgG
MSALQSAATGMMGQELKIDVIANNIANISTNGYKRRDVVFQDLLYIRMQRPGYNAGSTSPGSPSGIQIGLGVNVGSIHAIFEQGPLKQTNNPTDVAISGEGFFRIQTPDGKMFYTRDGAFKINAAGQLVTSDGMEVSPGITLPEGSTEVTIASNGDVSAKVNGNNIPQNFNRIDLAVFINPKGLEPVGKNLFIETESSGTAVIGAPEDPGFASLIQRYIEESNVSSVMEITEMIKAQRAYEMSANVMEVAAEVLRKASNIQT